MRCARPRGPGQGSRGSTAASGATTSRWSRGARGAPSRRARRARQDPVGAGAAIEGVAPARGSWFPGVPLRSPSTATLVPEPVRGCPGRADDHWGGSSVPWRAGSRATPEGPGRDRSSRGPGHGGALVMVATPSRRGSRQRPRWRRARRRARRGVARHRARRPSSHVVAVVVLAGGWCPLRLCDVFPRHDPRGVTGAFPSEKNLLDQVRYEPHDGCGRGGRTVNS